MFAYLGLTFFSYADLKMNVWSWHLILISLLNILISRFIGIVCLLYFIKLCGHKTEITFRQALFVFASGIVRGAIAFGLVLQLNKNVVPDANNRSLITTTCLTLVVSTTLVFGSSMSLIRKVLVPPQEAEKVEYDESDNVEDVD